MYCYTARGERVRPLSDAAECVHCFAEFSRESSYNTNFFRFVKTVIKSLFGNGMFLCPKSGESSLSRTICTNGLILFTRLSRAREGGSGETLISRYPLGRRCCRANGDWCEECVSPVFSVCVFAAWSCTKLTAARAICHVPSSLRSSSVSADAGHLSDHDHLFQKPP